MDGKASKCLHGHNRRREVRPKGIRNEGILVLLIDISLTRYSIFIISNLKIIKKFSKRRKLLFYSSFPPFLLIFGTTFLCFVTSFDTFSSCSSSVDPIPISVFISTVTGVFQPLLGPPTLFHSAVWSFSLLPVALSSLALSAVGVFNPLCRP